MKAYELVSCQCFDFIPPEKTKKALVSVFPKVTNGNTGQKWVNLTEFFSYMQHVQTCFLRIVNATGFSLPIEGLEIHFFNTLI